MSLSKSNILRLFALSVFIGVVAGSARYASADYLCSYRDPAGATNNCYSNATTVSCYGGSEETCNGYPTQSGASWHCTAAGCHCDFPVANAPCE